MMKQKDYALVVVWYNVTEEQLHTCKNVSKNAPTIVVDNSSKAQESLLDATSTPATEGGMTYIPLYENTGIAHAQNVGIKKAKELGFRYVIFFDQDTKPDINAIEQLRCIFIAEEEKGRKIGCVGPCLIDENTGREYMNYRKEGQGKSQEVEMLMSSSTFTSIKVLDEVGWMDESLFIDFVDHEWCWRAGKKGYAVVQTEEVTIPHRLGKKTIPFMGYQFPVSAPYRYYYVFRNSIRLLSSPYPPIGWKLRTPIRLAVLLLFLAIHQREGLRYALKSISSE